MMPWAKFVDFLIVDTGQHGPKSADKISKLSPKRVTKNPTTVDMRFQKGIVYLHKMLVPKNILV